MGPALLLRFFYKSKTKINIFFGLRMINHVNMIFFFTNRESHVRQMTCVLHAVTIDADFDRQIHNDNTNNNGRNGSCLTWLATSRGEAQMAYNYRFPTRTTFSIN